MQTQRTRTQLEIINKLESGAERVDMADILYSYRQLSKLYSQEGNVVDAKLAADKVAYLEAANPVSAQQFYIDEMEEYDDIDTDGLSAQYRRLAEICKETGDNVGFSNAQARAMELQDLFVASGKSKRSTPRSELPSARSSDMPRAGQGGGESKGVDGTTPEDDAKAISAADAKGAGAGAGAGDGGGAITDSGAKTTTSSTNGRRAVRHDSISSPVVRLRPMSRPGVSRGGDRTNTAGGGDTGADAKGGAGASSSSSKDSKADHDHTYTADSKENTSSSSSPSKSIRFADMKVELDQKDIFEGDVDQGLGGGNGDDVYADDDFATEGPEDDAAEEKHGNRDGMGQLGMSFASLDKAEARDSLDTAATGALAGAAAPLSPEVTKAAKSRNPVLFITWDGEEASAVNVDKLKRFLKAKGYIVFEHAGGDCTGSSLAINGFDAANALATSASQETIDGTSSEAVAASSALGEGSLTGGSSVQSAPASSQFASARAKVSQVLVDQMTISTVFVACVTRAFTKNLNCKKLTLRMRGLQEELGLKKKKSAEMLYVMIHGDFTTESQPYHCRDGWLGYLLRDSLWSPAWSHAHIAGASEAIASTVNLRRNVVRLNPLHVLYIESRGQAGVCPPSQIG